MEDLPGTPRTSRRPFFRPGPGWIDIEGRERAPLSAAERVVADAGATGPTMRPPISVATSSAVGFTNTDPRPSSLLASPDGRALFLRAGPLWRDHGGGAGRLRAVLNEVEKRWRDVEADPTPTNQQSPI